MDRMNMKYQTKEEAQEVADIENMGRDYSFVYVEKVGEFYILKVK